MARLGVDPASPDCDVLFQRLSAEGVGYGGIFHSGWERWWEHRLVALGMNMCGDDLGDMTARERVACWNRQLGLNLIAARSPWTESDEFHPGFACAACGQPSDKNHSVALFDPVPAYVEKRRICWRCVATGRYENAGLSIDDGERYIVEKIQSGELQGG